MWQNKVPSRQESEWLRKEWASHILQNQLKENCKSNKFQIQKNRNKRKNFDKKLASNYLTALKYFAGRPTSDTRPYDGAFLGRNQEGRIEAGLFDAKGKRWSAGFF